MRDYPGGMHRRIAAAGTGLLSLAVLLTGCQYVTDPSPEPSSVTTTATASAGPTDVEPSAEEAEPTSQPPTTPSEEDLPGEPVEGFPEAGTSLTIIGVSAQEILNLRIGPGVDFASILRMPPDTDLVATGRNRDLGSSAGLWYQVRAGEEVGWVIAPYVAEPGATRDVTDDVDPPPSAGSRSALIDAVVAAWDPSGTSESVVVFGPVQTQDLQFRVDVLTGDDSVAGVRLSVVASADGDRYEVTRISATQLCARGVTGTGVCL